MGRDTDALLELDALGAESRLKLLVGRWHGLVKALDLGEAEQASRQVATLRGRCWPKRVPSGT